jgi:hypothetical protein
MRKILCAVLTASLAAPAAFIVASPAAAATYWKCEDGFQFKVDGGTAAQCHRDATTRDGPLVPCPPGWDQIDNSGRDQCRLRINNTRTDRVCPPPPVTYIVQNGRDTCRVGIAAQDRPPIVPTSR